MFFNSMQREEPYLDLTWCCKRTETCDLRGCTTDAAWLSSARVVRCWVKSRNERNPRGVLPALSWGLTPDCRWQTGGRWGRRQVIMALTSRARNVLQWPLQRVARPQGGANLIQKRSKFGSGSATRPREGGVASNRGSACRGEYVPGPCTHRPSHHGSRQYPKSARLTPFRGGGRRR